MTQQLLLDILPASPPTLGDFIVGCNGAALHAVASLAPGRALYLWGGAGSGRTHLLRALCGDRGGLYLAAGQCAATLLALAGDERPIPPLVAIDDVDALPGDAQAGLFGLFNLWRLRGGSPQAFALLLAGSQAPRTLALREDLRTRLAWDLVYRLEQLSDADRAAALRERARLRGLPLGDDLIDWILRHLDRDMRKLIALVDALDRHSLARHRPITLPLLKELLSATPSDTRTP